MSNLDRTPGLTALPCSAVESEPVRIVYEGKTVPLGEATNVRRLLPNLGRRMVGAWCFVDHYGPDDIADAAGMQVPPHPHLGLQTVSWLRAGSVRHRDSLGSDVLVQPGQLGLMTAGRGIAHAEHSPVPHPALLHGAQLWVALPDSALATAPTWEHHVELPVFRETGLDVTVILGALGGAQSPGTTFSDLVGAEVRLPPDAAGTLPLEPEFEHAVLMLDGAATVDDVDLKPGAMIYLGCGRTEVGLRAEGAATALLLGGAPFDSDVLMWWNFVGRTHDEIAEARTQWQAGQRFGSVAGAGDPLAAPPLPPGRLKAGGSSR